MTLLASRAKRAEELIAAWKELLRANTVSSCPEKTVRESLSKREREVIDLLEIGLGNLEIAAQLGISPRTVETHLRRIRQKLTP